jgi:hypothetical protein
MPLEMQGLASAAGVFGEMLESTKQDAAAK